MSRFLPLIRRAWAPVAAFFRNRFWPGLVLMFAIHLGLAGWLLITAVLSGYLWAIGTAALITFVIAADFGMCMLWLRQRNTAYAARDLAERRFMQACADFTIMDNERLRLLAENGRQAQTILNFGRIEQQLGVRRNGER
jgi:hypothetical protein